MSGLSWIWTVILLDKPWLVYGEPQPEILSGFDCLKNVIRSECLKSSQTAKNVFS